MKKQILLGLALASWWTSLLLGQSPPPPPTPTVKAEDEQDLGATKQHNGTATPPPVISPIQHDVSAKDKDNQNGQRSTNQRIDILAWVVAFAAVAQFIAAMVQAYYMRRSLDVTEKAADAAKDSADVATKAVALAEKTAALTERAVVLLSSVELSSEMIHKNSVVIFTLKNFGRTVAHNVTLTGRCDCGLSGVDVVEPTSGATIAPEGTAEWLTKSLILGMQHAHIERLTQRTLLLNFSIEAKYADVFGQAYRYEAEGRYEPGAGIKRFVITSTRLKPA